MSIEFKKKFSIVFACYVLMTSLHLPLFKVYADEKTSIQKVYTDLRKEFDYDEKTDTYYFPQVDVDRLPDKQGRSATVAVSGAVISSVLALAVKAGLDFASTNSLSEFVSRFFMLDGISSVVSGLNSAVKNSVGGVVNFSKSLLDTVGSKFAELMNENRVTSVYIQGRKFPVLPYDGTGNIDDALARYTFESSILPKTSILTDEIGRDYINLDSDIWVPASAGFGNISFRVRCYRSTPYSDDAQIRIKKSDGTYVSVYNQYTTIQTPSGTFKNGFKAYLVPYLTEGNPSGSDYFQIGFILAVYSTVTGYLSYIEGLTTWGEIPMAHTSARSKLPVIGSAWSDGKITDEEELNIKVPSDTNVLINKKPSDIVDNPSYDVWTPGVTVVPPTIDTGTDSPPLDDVLPPIIDDIPGDDTTTTPPGEDSIPSLNFDWLKELFNKLLELIQSIIDWLTNFWDNLLEFIKSIFVPSEGYFIDVFNDILSSIKEKIPGVDVSKLEQLAVGEQEFEDIYATFFGVKCLVVKGSIINRVVSWGRPIIQGIIALFLLLYNYNQIYFLFRGSRLSSNSSEK